MRVLRNKKAPHIAQHHQDVLVNGIDVEQIMLHLPHNFAKHPQIAAQHRCLVHQPHGVGQTLRLLQNRHEGGAVHRVFAKRGVHHLACVVQSAQGAGG